MYPAPVAPRIVRAPETPAETAARIARNKAGIAELANDLRQSGFEVAEDACEGEIHVDFWKPSRSRVLAALQRFISGPGYSVYLRREGYFFVNGLNILIPPYTLEELRANLKRAGIPIV